MQSKLLLVCCGLAAIAASAGRAATTPIEKVINLLEDLKTEVETEGTDEATNYDEFACFCKDQTDTKSTSILEGKDAIDSLSADIEEKTASKESKSTEVKERQATHETLSADLEKTTEQCAKDEAEYDANAADLSKALDGLSKAIRAMEDSKPAMLEEVAKSLPGASTNKTVAAANKTAAVVNKTAAVVNKTAAVKHEAVKKTVALLEEASRVDPEDPEYKYHSHGIIETMEELEKDFTDKKKDLDDEWEKTKETCEKKKESLGEQIDENNVAMDDLNTDIETLLGEIAEHRTELVDKELLLSDDQLYMKDLTSRCEARATEWDQRTQMRAGELEALEGALQIMKDNVSSIEGKAVDRAFLQNGTAAANKSSFAAKARNSSLPSFLQELSEKVAPHRAMIQSVKAVVAKAATLSPEARQEKALNLLAKAGNRLSSTSLALLASRLVADPFAKVKTLIQKLIERLLAEANAEATKKGFCDKELGKAKKDRDYRLSDAKKLNLDISALETKFDELTAEIAELSSAVTELTYALGNATEMRNEEKEVNLETLKDARGGVNAVGQAMTILKLFYKRAAKGKVFIQAGASPVDEDTDGPGFSGKYKGKQEASRGIIGMLEVIRTDFERTIRKTEAAEKKAAEEHVQFDRASRTDISGKEKKIQLDEEDLEKTNTTMTQKMDDLKTNMELLDSALKVIEDLKPTCIDTGMSYEDRVAKREEEIEALKSALCILDPEGVEADCK